MNIAFFEIQEGEKKELANQFKKHKVKFFADFLSDQNINKIKDCEIISIFIYSKINQNVLSKLPKLKYIVTRSMGTDHIDFEACKKFNVKVSNAPHYGDNSVAEHTFGLILSLSRNIHKAYLRNMNENHQIDGLKGFDIRDKTLGVIGTGRIGMNVIEIARGFKMKVLANDHHPDKKLAKGLGFKYESLEKLLKESDIVTLHIPYCKENHHLINDKRLKLMKSNSLLINTARGQIVDTSALISALNKGKLGGAGLDVIEGEDLIKEEKELLHNHTKLNVKKMNQLALDHKIIQNERVVFTPHIAFYSEEAIQRILDVTVENIQSFIKSKPINIVT